jgi:hypothetical protein
MQKRTNNEEAGMLTEPSQVDAATDLGVEVFAAYRAYIFSLDPDLRELADSYIQERVDATNKSVPVVAYLAPLLSDLFGIGDRSVIRQAGIACFCFDHYTHLIDDATDEINCDVPAAIHLSNQLLSRGLNIMLDLCDGSSAFRNIWEKYVRESFAAERYLWRHHREFVVYTETDLEMVGKRGGIAKISAGLFAALSNKWDLLEEVEKSIEKVSSAIQLVDDFIDWKTDLASGIYNHTLVLAHDRLKLTNALALTEKDFGEAIATGKIGEIVLKQSSRLLETAMHFPSAPPASQWIRFIAEMKDSIDRASMALTEIGTHSPNLDPDAYFNVVRTLRLQH